MEWGTKSTLSLLCVLVALVSRWHLVTGARDTPTAEEATALAKLRPMVADSLYRDYMMQDTYLLRWLRHLKLDVNRAANSVRMAHKWRQDNNIDTILNENFASYEKMYPFDVSSVDKEGRPVWLLPYGKWDVRKAALAGEIAKYSRYLDYMYEKVATRVRELDQQNPDKNITQAVLLLDMQGYNLRQQGCLVCAPGNTHFILAYERYYAGLAYRSILINTPGIFEQLFAIIKPLQSETSARAVTVLGFDQQQWVKEVFGLVSRDQLPPQFGGTKKVTRTK